MFSCSAGYERNDFDDFFSEREIVKIQERNFYDDLTPIKSFISMKVNPNVNPPEN